MHNDISVYQQNIKLFHADYNMSVKKIEIF